MKNAFNIIKIVVLWNVIAFIGILALASLPSFTWIFALPLAAFIAPVKPWQTLIKKYIKLPVRIIIIVALSFSMLLVFPTSDEDTSNDALNSTTVVTQPTIDPTTDDSAASITKPTTEPTTVPTTEPPHVHTFSEATCTSPKICTDCGETSGTAPGHKWAVATCMIPKTCTVCGTTTGNPAEHIWKAATCTQPKTCTSCGTTEGSTAQHNWKAATHSAPKTCTNCGATEGSPLEIPGGENYHGHVYTGGSSSTKYHYEADCAGKYSHEITWEEVERRNLGPCKTCVLH